MRIGQTADVTIHRLVARMRLVSAANPVFKGQEAWARLLLILHWEQRRLAGLDVIHAHSARRVRKVAPSQNYYASIFLSIIYSSPSIGL